MKRVNKNRLFHTSLLFTDSIAQIEQTPQQFNHFAMALNLHCYCSSARFLSLHPKVLRSDRLNRASKLSANSPKFHRIRTSANSNNQLTLRTCRNCKTQFDPSLNHPRACRFHTAHFGGETKRKFESVHTGGTMDTPDSGKVLQYWHCCGSEDPFDPGCTAAPHSSYDDD